MLGASLSSQHRVNDDRRKQLHPVVVTQKLIQAHPVPDDSHVPRRIHLARSRIGLEPLFVDALYFEPTRASQGVAHGGARGKVSRVCPMPCALTRHTSTVIIGPAPSSIDRVGPLHEGIDKGRGNLVDHRRQRARQQ